MALVKALAYGAKLVMPGLSTASRIDRQLGSSIGFRPGFPLQAAPPLPDRLQLESAFKSRIRR
jgi:hypothetical protein